MRKTHNFAPLEYMRAVRESRKRLFINTLMGVVGMSVLFVGIISTTGYAKYFSTEIASAGDQGLTAPPTFKSYRFQPLPDKQENLNSNIEEEIVEDYEDEEVFDDTSAEEDFVANGCNVLGIIISGDMGTDYGATSATYITDTLESFEGSESVKAVLVEVDSGGGSPVAADEIKEALANQSVPVVAQVREMGFSAAYMAILPSDRIFVHRYGSVGSIGVIIPHYDYTEQNIKEGIKYQPIKTGKFKDMANGQVPLTEEERQILQSEINFIYEGFIADVAKYRKLSVDQVRTLADGKTWLAHKAKELGLIDEVGGREEVTTYLRETISAEPVVCWY